MKNIQNTIFFSFLIILFSFPSKAISQDSSWGIGLLKIDYERHEIKLYDAPKGAIKGSLGMEGSNGYHELTYREEGPSLIFPENAFRRINLDESRLTVFKEQDGFIQIFSADGESQAWVSLIELAKTKSQYEPWIDFMSDPNNLFFAQNYGMNIRVEPAAHSKRITTAKGEKFSIKPTGIINGLWAEVIVVEYDQDYCHGGSKIIREYRGHMKILDDKGYPNVWFGGPCC